MRRRNRAGARKEKAIMVLSSVFVLAALTVTGLFLKEKNEEKSDGYVVDFSTIEEDAQQQAKQESTYIQESPVVREAKPGAVTEDDLDYDPNFQEANSLNVENEQGDVGQADEALGQQESKAGEEEGMIDETLDVDALRQMEDQEALATTIQPALTFSDKDSLTWPVVGNVLINYSMDKTIYFPTLQQYKYNPAIVISAVEGEMITAAADGKVLRVYTDPEIGTAVVMELGGGYEVTYGQLKDVTVSEGGYVTRGDIIGSASAPTKYFVQEGCNVYFKLMKDGVPINPMTKLS